MIDFLRAQLDYINFAYGLAFVLLAAVGRTLSISETARLPWTRLALFALCRGLAEWLGVFRATLPAGQALEMVAFALVIVAYVALLDFCRVATCQGTSPWDPRLFWAVVTPFFLVGVAWGLSGLRLSVQYGLVIPAVFWAAILLWRAGTMARSGGGLRITALSLGGTALATLLFAPRVAWLPSLPGIEYVLVRGAFPIQLLRMLCALGAAFGIWVHYCGIQRRSQETASAGWRRFERGITLALILLLAGGWVATQSIGFAEDREQRAALEARAVTMAAMMPTDALHQALGQAVATPVTEDLASLLLRLCRDQADLRDVAVIGVDGPRLSYLAQADRVQSAGRAGRVGAAYTDADATALEKVFRGQPTTLSVRHGDERELAALAPVRDHGQGPVLALLDLHVSLESTRRAVAQARAVPILATLLACGCLLAFFIAQRRHAQAAARLSDSERRYRNLVESSPNSVVLLDAVGCVIAINRPGAAMLGLQPHHLLGRVLSDLWPERERAMMAQAIGRARNGQTVTVTADFQRADGSILAVESVFTRASGPDDPDCLLVGVSNDVTERQRTRLALERRHRFTELILGCSSRFLTLGSEAVDQAIRDALRDLGRFLGVDRAQLFRLLDDQASFGLTHEWCAAGVGSRQRELQAVETDSYPWLWPTLETHGFVTAADVRMLPADAVLERGSLVAQGVKSFACVAVQREGQVVGFLGLDSLREPRQWPADELGLVRVMADVLASALARRRVEEALRDREEVFRSISVAAQDAIVMIDQDGRISVWNQAAERMFGYPRAEAEGRPVHDLIAPEQYESAYTVGYALFQQSGQGAVLGAPQQLMGRRKDGSEFPVELSASAIELRGRWHAVAIIRDITERVRIDEALWKAKEATEAANEELRRAVERAERLAQEAAVANSTKSDFLANMSHEIRTPMNGILGMTGLLLDSELEEEQREYAETVKSCAESLLTIVNDILDFSKVEAGKLELELLDFDLGATLEDATDILAVRAHQKDLELTCGVEPETPMLLQGDPGRLRQILTNLVGNAIKFTTTGEVAISVSVRERTARDVLLHFAVRDTGVGIPADKVGQLFQPFTQVDSSTTRRFGGTGLGLSISRRLAELMGGAIGVESQEGHGSTFWFTARFLLQTAVPAPPPPLAEIQGLRVLVVDDNETNRRVMRGLLENWGCRAETTDAAEPARQLLARGVADGDPFRVVILDMMMPGETGDRLGASIKCEPRFAASRLVMMTSIGRRGDAAKFEELGFSAYLTKPVKTSHLRAALRSIVGAEETGTLAPRILTRHTLREVERRKRRILLAEDNITNQKVAVKLLERQGHRVDAVANGLEALRALRERPYDLVLMDVQMPEMDGFEATKQVRRPGSGVRNPRIPIIAMTAHAMKGDRERCLEAGMDDYVSKPIQPEALAAAIARWEGPEPEESAVEDPALPAAQSPAAREPQPYVPPAEEQAAPPFGRETLLTRLGGDEEVFDEIVQIYLEDLPGLLESMATSLQSGDTVTLRRNAHSLKGSSGTVGATHLQAAAFALEQAAARADVEECGRLLVPVKTLAADVSETMSGWLTKGEPR